MSGKETDLARSTIMPLKLVIYDHLLVEGILTSPTSPTDMDAASPNTDMPCSLEVAEWCSGEASSGWKPSF